MSKTIEIIVSPAGETRLETKGFSGSECQEASRFLEEAMGNPIREEVTEAFFVTVAESLHEEQR